MVKILDSTLREGEQTHGVKFTLEQKVELAKLLDGLGVDYIEAGHPLISEYDKECVKAIANLGLNAEILGHARARKEDIDAVAQTGCNWTGIFCGINDLSRSHKLNGKNKQEVYSMIKEAIGYAKSKKLKVRYTLEDATRTPIEEIFEIAKLAENEGADRFSVADTVGCATPENMFELISKIKQKINIDLESHCHNDYGLALANSLAACKAGVNVIDVAVNGLGERAGITSLQELYLCLNNLYKIQIGDLSKIDNLSKKVVEMSGVMQDALSPITGENSFTHTAKLHRKAVVRCASSYEPFDPALLSKERKIVLPYVIVPKKIPATELSHHHGDAPGERYVFIDDRFFPNTHFYAIGRRVESVPRRQGEYVDNHAHNCDSFFIFIGDNEDLTGLDAKIKFAKKEYEVKSPSATLIPKYLEHTYQLINGRGWFFNIVRSLNYQSSLTEKTESLNINSKSYTKMAKRIIKRPKIEERPIITDMKTIQNPERYIFVDPSLFNHPGLYIALHNIRSDMPFAYNMTPHYHDTDELYVLFNRSREQLTINLENNGLVQRIKSPSLIYHQAGSVHKYSPVLGDGKILIVLEERKPGEGYYFKKKHEP